MPACSSTTTSAPSLVHQPPVNHRCNVTTRTSRGFWTTTLRDTIRSEVTACVIAAMQNLLPSSSSTIDLIANAGPLRPTHGQTGSTSVSLPTASVPSRTADHILRGEYIDFNDLLPEALGLAQHPAGQLRLQIGDHGAVLLADQGTSSTRVKRHVHDFSTWMEAWTTYLCVLVSSAPERAPELLAYQAIITDAKQKFRSDGWLAYDSQFRAAASNNRHRRECPAITYMAMGFRPRSFPVGGMYVKGVGRLTKVKKKSLAPLFHCFLNGKSTSQILRVYLTGNEKRVREAQR